MTPPVPIDAAMRDPRLLGAALGDPDTWATWLAAFKAAFALRLTRQERRAFAAIAGGRPAPAHAVRELWAIAGRRAGKSRMAACLAVFIAALIDHRSRLAPGETGYVLVLAASKPQAEAVFRYALGFLQAAPLLADLIEAVTTDEIRLRGNIVIATHPNSFRTVRGRTLLAAILDEVAFWRDEATANPDVETYRAVLPALATTRGLLIGISSPYRRVGLLAQKHREAFGAEDDDVLVVSGGTAAFNPTIDTSEIERARRDDPQAALAEWDGQFRADIAAFLDDALIDAAIDHGRPLELPPRSGLRYRAFIDASAGRHDAFTLAIGHREGERVVADVVRGRRPPFDPASVAVEFAGLARTYGCRSVTGDAYAGEWVSAAFRKAGVGYLRSPLDRSTLYLEALPAFTRGQIAIPDHPQLVRELRLLERRTARSGRDSVDHGAGGHDDHANALAGMAHLLATGGGEKVIAPVVVRSSDFAPTFGLRAAFAEIGGPTETIDFDRRVN